MNVYDLTLLLRVLPKSELTSVLKRTAESIFDKGGIIRSISNVGQKPTPFKMSKNAKTYREACYFILEFNYPPPEISALAKLINRDVDVIRGRIFPQVNFEVRECTFEEEMRPAPYRSEVQEMMANRKIRGTRFSKKFEFNNGLGYNPL